LGLEGFKRENPRKLIGKNGNLLEKGRKPFPKKLKESSKFGG